jgi:hypothetical protein
VLCCMCFIKPFLFALLVQGFFLSFSTFLCLISSYYFLNVSCFSSFFIIFTNFWKYVL